MTMRRAALLLLCTLALPCALALPGCTAWRAVYDPPRDALTPGEHYDLGRAYASEGRAEDAERQYALAAQDLPEAWLPLGVVRFSLGRFEEAALAFERAVEARPEEAEPRNNLAWTLLTLGRDLPRAEELAREALALASEQQRPACEDTLERILAARAAQPQR
jgi:tetratricopeptide (TPR) repeat protein